MRGEKENPRGAHFILEAERERGRSMRKHLCSCFIPLPNYISFSGVTPLLLKTEIRELSVLLMQSHHSQNNNKTFYNIQENILALYVLATNMTMHVRIDDFTPSFMLHFLF